MLYFRCIKGKADADNINVIIVQGDIVKYIGCAEGDIAVEGIAGFCTGFELSFTPSQFTEMFESYGLTVVLK